jgi:hypothetical protein
MESTCTINCVNKESKDLVMPGLFFKGTTMFKAISALLGTILIAGCASTPGSFAYEVANASERSKYTRDTIVSQEQMDALEQAGASLEESASEIKFNDAGFTYGFGQATDAATVGAIAGSATGLLDSMSGLDMAMFGAMAVFDSSHIDKARINLASAFVVRGIDPKNNNEGKKGYVVDLKYAAEGIDNALGMLASESGWTVHPSWGSPKLDRGISRGYTGTGACAVNQVLLFTGMNYYRKSLEKGHSVVHGVLEGENVGFKDGDYNAVDLGFTPWCAPVDPKSSRKNFVELNDELELSLYMKLSLIATTPKDVYFYIPPSKNGLPVPALLNQGKVYWMAIVK